jgi:phenylalanyl-tRNA synthetase alpha chain
MIVEAFAGLGYTAVTGPEVESDWFNFTALNIPRDHPARSLHDTIYVAPLDPADGPDATLLRTHTSPMQARTMLAGPPPVFVVVPGRVYRQDTPDATHLPVFHQVEGLAVDEGLSFADLRGTLAAFARALLGADTRIRLRPHYFPFTEPSCEVDAWLGGRDGRWVELLGAGMVHPNVLLAAGYDPQAVSGFAFGIGVERVAMLRHGITDLRLFVENDLRFLTAF